jgi:hypothetical protein
MIRNETSMQLQGCVKRQHIYRILLPSGHLVTRQMLRRKGMWHVLGWKRKKTSIMADWRSLGTHSRRRGEEDWQVMRWSAAQMPEFIDSNEAAHTYSQASVVT